MYDGMAQCCQHGERRTRGPAIDIRLRRFEYSYHTGRGTRRTEASATMDHPDIRRLVTAVHVSDARLPRSKVGDHSEGCPHNVLEDSPHRVRASRSYSSVLRLARCCGSFFTVRRKSIAYKATGAAIARYPLALLPPVFGAFIGVSWIDTDVAPFCGQPTVSYGANHSLRWRVNRNHARVCPCAIVLRIGG